MADILSREGFDLSIEMGLTRRCNFSCPYCFNKSSSYEFKEWFKKKIFQKRFINPSDIDTIVSRLEKVGKNTLIGLGGGEPFLFQGFLELCQKLTRKNHIYVSTNLSHRKVYDFAETINPKKVQLLYISAHILELEKYNLLSDFISKVDHLKKKGFVTWVVYVMYPPFFKRFMKDYNYFKSKGIEIHPKIFEGQYKSKIYPQAYTKKQKEFLSKFLDNKYHALLYTGSNYYGKLCSAGKKEIVITHDGFIYRCWGEYSAGVKPIGNILKDKIRLFKDVKPCKVNYCPCFPEGLDYTVNK